jgi:hypothetical protein
LFLFLWSETSRALIHKALLLGELCHCGTEGYDGSIFQVRTF